MWEAAERHQDVPGLGTAAEKAFGRFMRTMQRLKERVDASAPVGDLLEELLSETGYIDALKAERTIEAQGRLENLEELVHVAREYDATNPEGSLDEFLQQIALLADADTIRDDEGLVTLMTLHNAKGLEFPIVFIIGLRGRRLPALARDRGGQRRGGAPARLRRPHPRDARPHPHLRAPAQLRSARNSFGMRSRFLDEIPRELTDQAQREASGLPAPGRAASWSGAAAASAELGGDGGGNVFRLGDDVVHAAFGEGVVTGTEPGGIVVVRFAERRFGAQADGRLRADPPPLRRAAEPRPSGFEPAGGG